jgi:PKD repeat protein
VSVTFTDDSFGEITSRTLDFGDGSPTTSQTTTSHIYGAAGTYTAALTVTGPGGTHTRTRTIVVQPNYSVSQASYGWVDTSGFTSVSLTDDSSRGPLPIGFNFGLYGNTYTTAYIGSNGLLTLGSGAGATTYVNTAIPSSSTPNAALYPHWDDLDPSVAGTIKYGQAPDGSFVVSWEGVPVYGQPAVTLTFQAILEVGGGVVFQYAEVQPASPYGAGRSATVGLEDATGVGRRCDSASRRQRPPRRST